MKKRDIILVVCVIAAALILYAVLKLTSGESGSQAVVTIDGDVYGTYSLDTPQEIEIETEYGTNVLCIEDGEIYMVEADCPDGYCISQGKISRGNETIVCLPHKLVVTISSDEEQEDDFDAITN